MVHTINDQDPPWMNDKWYYEIKNVSKTRIHKAFLKDGKKPGDYMKLQIANWPFKTYCGKEEWISLLNLMILSHILKLIGQCLKLLTMVKRFPLYLPF